MRTDLPEVTASGLVLWQLWRSPNRHLVCRVIEFEGELYLGVSNVTTRGTSLGEAHPDVVSVIHRSDAIRNACLSKGWTEVDSETSELRNEA